MPDYIIARPDALENDLLMLTKQPPASFGLRRLCTFHAQLQDLQLRATSNRSFRAPVTSLSALCLNLWTSICLYLVALFTRASTHIVRAFHSADIGIITDTTSNPCSTCVVLALVAGPQQLSSQRFYHDCNCSLGDAFQCIAQPNTTLLECILYHNTSMIPAVYQALQISASLGMCI